MSYSTSKVFDPDTLFNNYQTAYCNIVDISMNTEASLEDEFSLPLPVNYIDPGAGNGNGTSMSRKELMS